MNNKIISTITAATLLASGAVLPITAGASGLAAFPGAEGGGMYATGGRGGRVVHVTNLNDSGTGSFRDAVSGSNRIVVFDVGGTINLSSDVVVKGNVTVLGQTAPGGHGVTLRGGKIGMGGDNIIIRFISSRPGETGKENDGWGGSAGSNSIVDHCSIGWANDEMWGLYSNNMNQTVQYTIVGPANCISVHDKGAHGFGVMLGKGQSSWHHNLIAHNISRNFRGKIEGTNGFDFVNNVIYDWGYETAYGTLGHLNYVNNYLKAGNSTRGSHRFINRSSGSNYEKFRIYITGNTLRNVDGSVYSSEIDADNWKGVTGFDGVDVGGGVILGEALNRVSTPNKVTASDGSSVSVAANAESAEDAFLHVTSYAGAAIDASSRTMIDNEVLNDALNGTGYLTGGRKFSGVTESALLEAISKYDIREADYDSYYPEAVAKTITDSDNDGMPDEWELARGLDPNSASDATGDYLGQGYKNIEYYANDLTANAFPPGVVTLSPETTELGAEYAEAKEDIDSISLSPTTVTEASQLTLPQTGKNGYELIWSSSSSAIKITNNNISEVNRPTGDTDAKVTLTATVVLSGYTLKRTFTITVPSRSMTWIPSSDAAAGSTLMEGLTCISDVTVASGKNYTINGETLTTAANCGKGSWSNGAAAGGGLKFTAPETGFLSVYVPSLSDTSNGGARMVYMTEEGSASREDCTASISSYDGAYQMMVGYVEAGHTYYVFLAGGTTTVSKVSFSVTAPLRWWKASADVEQGGEPMKGLAASEAMTYTAGAQTIDGIEFTGSVSGTNNPGGTPKGETGSAFRYTPEADGRLTIYYKLNSGKTFVLTDANGELLENFKNSGASSIYTSSTLTLNGGETYYMYVDGSKAAFCGAAFEQTGARSTPKPEEDEPTATPDPYAAPTAVPAPAAVTAAENDFTGDTADYIISSTQSDEAISSSKVSGMTLYVGPRTNGNDYSTLFKYADGGVSGTALLMQSGAYATVNRGPRFIITKPQVSGNNVITASFKAKPVDENSLLRYNDLLYEDNAGKSSYAQDLGLTKGEWNDVRVVISEKNGETTRQIFVNGIEKATDGNAEFPVFWGSQTNGAELYIDDLKVTTQELPGATIAVAQGRAYTDSTGVPVKAWAATMALNGNTVNRIVWEIDVDGVKKYAVDETASISGASEIKLGLIIEADTADEAGIAQINRLGTVSAEAQ